MLEVEADAPALELEEEHFVAVIKGAKGPRDHGLLCLICHAPVVHLDAIHRRDLLQEALKHLHLVVELAEDDPARRGRGRLHLAAQGVEFGRGADPVVARIVDPLALARVDIDLRMQGDLAEAHYQREEHGRLVALEGAPAPHHNALNASVELGLVLRVKVQKLLDDRGRAGELLEHRAHLGHGAVEAGRGHERRKDRELLLLVAHELKERLDVFFRVHHWRGRDAPRGAPAHGVDGSPDLAGADPYTLGLVQDDTVPVKAKHLLAHQLLIVGDEEHGLAGAIGRGHRPGLATDF